MAGAHGPGDPRAPDGGWGWVVCFGSFVIQAITIGITYTFGVLFVDLLTYFGKSESETAWIGSIQPCLLYFTGITAGPLLLRYGWRLVTISGAVLSCIGFVTSAFAPQLWVLYITYGMCTGIGNGLMYVTSMVTVQHYFNKYRATATGLAVSGSGVGTLIFSLLTQWLLDTVGWRYTILTNGIITLVGGVIVGCLYVPLPEPPVDDVKKHKEQSNNSRTSLSGKIPDVAEKVKENEKTPLIKKHHSNDRFYLSSSSIASRPHSTEKSLTYSIQYDPSEQGTHCCKCCKCTPCTSSALTVLGEIFDVSLFKNPIFVLFAFSVQMFAFGYHTPFTYIPERSIRLGFSSTKASALISIMGVANVGARLLFGWIADKSEKIRFYFAGIVFCLGGILTILVFLYTTYPALIVYSILFGACSGCFAALFPVILVDLLGIDLIEKSLGQTLAITSFGFLLASPLSGWIIALTDSYDVPFMVVGALELFGGIMYFTIKCLIPIYGYKEPADTTAEEDFDEERDTFSKAESEVVPTRGIEPKPLAMRRTRSRISQVFS